METKPPLARRSHTLLSTRDRDRERERDVITLSRYRLCERNESSLFLSFHLLHVENNDPRCFNCSQPGVLFDSMRWTNTWIDRGSIWPQRSIRESARFVEKSDGTTRHYRPTTIICDGLKPRITAKRSQSGPDNPANSSGPNQRVPINFRSHNDRLPPSSPDLIGPSPYLRRADTHLASCIPSHPVPFRDPSTSSSTLPFQNSIAHATILLYLFIPFSRYCYVYFSSFPFLSLVTETIFRRSSSVDSKAMKLFNFPCDC